MPGGARKDFNRRALQGRVLARARWDEEPAPLFILGRKDNPKNMRLSLPPSSFLPNYGLSTFIKKQESNSKRLRKIFKKAEKPPTQKTGKKINQNHLEIKK